MVLHFGSTSRTPNSCCKGMGSFYCLSDRQAEIPQIAGQQVSHLATLMGQGYRALPGIVVPVPLWHQFLAHVDWGEPLIGGMPQSALQVDIEAVSQLQQTAQRLQQAIAVQPLPAPWQLSLSQHLRALQSAAVMLRPSIVIATTTNTTETAASIPITGLLRDQLAEAAVDSVSGAIKAIWMQLFQAKSLFYWQRQGIPLAQVGLAVLIQPLRRAIASGTMALAGQKLSLSAVYGLGQLLAPGEAHPEQHQVDIATGQMRQIAAAQQAYAYWFQPQKIARIKEHSSKDSTASNPDVSSQCPREAINLEAVPYLRQRPVRCQPGSIITPLQQQQLISLGHALAQQKLAQSGLLVEWILCGDRQGNRTIHISQVTLEVESTAGRDPAITTGSEGTAITLMGLGASPGQVSGRLQRVTSPREPVPAHAIILAVDITPDWLPLLQRVKGVITEQGGLTSHAAILTRELGIPSVVGALKATQQLSSGDRVSIDGDRGLITRFGDAAPPADAAPPQPALPTTLVQSTGPEASPAYRIRPMGSFCSLSPPCSASKTKLMLTLSQVTQLYRVTQVPIDGIGLLRSELLLLPLLKNQHPLHWLATGRRAPLVERIAACVSQLAAAVFPDPVFYRSLSLRTDEFSQMEGAPVIQERNPTLGEHGAYSYGIYPELFQAEVSALRQVQRAGYSNLRLLLPFVRAVDEVTYAQKMVYQAELTVVESFQLWIMAEVPSVLFLLPEYARIGVQGIAIGSNDLAQLLFAADRNHPTLSSTFHNHPALLQVIRQLIIQAKQLGIGCSLCGDLPSSSPQIIPDLIEWGIDMISVPAASAAAVQQAIARAEGLSTSPDENRA